MIAVEVAMAMGADLGFATLDELRADLSASVPAFADVDWASLVGASDGPLLAIGRNWQIPSTQTFDPPPADGYGLRLVVDRKLWDLGTTVQQSASLAKLPDQACLGLSPGDFAALGVEAGATVIVEWNGGRQAVPVHPSPAVAKGTAHLPFRLPGIDAGVFMSADRLVTDLRVTAG
jgi:anaerobic selenocysteine-containing dehydrogenase